MYDYKLPEDFLLGTANSAFQSEGAWDRDGKSETIMDSFARAYAGKISEKANKGSRLTEDMPDRGCFFYDNYEAYIEDMQKTGQNTYRLSLAWSRIIPTGYGEVNPKGIEFYNKVIDKLVACNIVPLVDLYHWDLPQCLFEEGGFENPKFPQWFEDYAKVCFEAFGDRVKLWSTFNESAVALSQGYGTTSFPPYLDRADHGILAGHYCILAHYRAVRLYKSMNLGGKIGAVNCVMSLHPEDHCEDDVHAVERQMLRRYDWWLEPMMKGHYPQKLLDECPRIAEAMPPHFQQDLDQWFMPMDFIGINYYVTRRVRYKEDTLVKASNVFDFFSQPGKWFEGYPAGIADVVLRTRERYGDDVEMYITENGCALQNINDPEKECDDDERIHYIREHLRMLYRLIKMGVKVKGYYYWNDADSYEAMSGYFLRFGLTWVDHQTGERRWKKSRHWFSKVCKTRILD